MILNISKYILLKYNFLHDIFFEYRAYVFILDFVYLLKTVHHHICNEAFVIATKRFAENKTYYENSICVFL